jgi:hypothetical protein
MPTQFWKHQCPGRPEIQTGSPYPCGCGEPKVYDGWHNDRFEAMAWYQKFYGLKPIGPHRKLEERLFEGTCRPCDACSGRGYFDAAGGRTFAVCDKCGGAGRCSTISMDERLALRAQVLAAFPDAAAPYDLPNPAFGTILHHVGDNVMLVIPDPPDG